MKRLLSWLLLIAMLVPMGASLPVWASSGKLELLSVTALNDYQVALKFSEELRTETGTGSTPWIVNQINNTANVALGIAWVADTVTGQEGFGSVTTGAVAGTVALGETDDTLIWTVTSQTDANVISSILTETKEGYTRKFYFYDNGCGWFSSGYIGAIQNADGSKALSVPDGYARAAAYEYMFMDITPADELELESVVPINEYTLRVTFNQDVDPNSLSLYAHLRLLDPNGVWYYENGVDYGYNVGNGLKPTADAKVWTWTMPFESSEIASTNKPVRNRTVNDVLKTWEGKLAEGYKAALMITDNGDAALNTADPATYPGYNKRIQAVDGGYLKTTHRWNNTNDYVFQEISAYTDDAPEVKSITILNQNELKIAFTTTVEIAGKPHMALRLLDDKGNTVDGKVMYGDAVWYWADDSHTAIIWNAGVKNMLDFINLEGEWADWQGKGTVKFIIEEYAANGHTAFTPNNRVDQIFNPETGDCLMATGKGLNVYENAVHVIDGTDTRPALTVKSAAIISDNQIKVVFSDEISIHAFTPWISLRIVNENNGFIDNAKWQKRYATFEHLGNTIVFTFDADMMDMINLEGAYANIEGAAKTVLSFEEIIGKDGDTVVFQTYGNARIDNITKADGVMLTANLIASRTNYDGLILDLDQDRRGELVRVVKAVKVNSIQIQVTFSEPVDIPVDPYMALRVYDENGNLQRFTHDGQDIEAQVPFTWNYCDNSKTRITLTFPDNSMEELLTLTGKFAYLNTGTNKTYLTIEEYPVADVLETPGNGVIDNIIGENGKLAATVINTTGYERFVIGIGDEYEDPSFYLKSVVQTADKELTLTFSQPVSFDGDPYMGIRFVNDNNGLQYEDGQPLQYQGKWEYGNEEKTVLIWTATYGGSVTAIVNREGKFANYPDYAIMFCIEEIPADKERGDVEDGTIHNIFTDGGVRLYANSIGRGKHYDGLYVPITVAYKAPAASNKPTGIIIESKDEEEPTVPTATGPASDMVAMAIHTDKHSILPWIALGLASAVFAGVIAVLFVLLPKKKDEQ